MAAYETNYSKVDLSVSPLSQGSYNARRLISLRSGQVWKQQLQVTSYVTPRGTRIILFRRLLPLTITKYDVAEAGSDQAPCEVAPIYVFLAFSMAVADVAFQLFYLFALIGRLLFQCLTVMSHVICWFSLLSRPVLATYHVPMS